MSEGKNEVQAAQFLLTHSLDWQYKLIFPLRKDDAWLQGLTTTTSPCIFSWTFLKRKINPSTRLHQLSCRGMSQRHVETSLVWNPLGSKANQTVFTSRPTSIRSAQHFSRDLQSESGPFLVHPSVFCCVFPSLHHRVCQMSNWTAVSFHVDDEIGHRCLMCPYLTAQIWSISNSLTIWVILLKFLCQNNGRKSWICWSVTAESHCNNNICWKSSVFFNRSSSSLTRAHHTWISTPFISSSYFSSPFSLLCPQNHNLSWDALSLSHVLCQFQHFCFFFPPDSRATSGPPSRAHFCDVSFRSDTKWCSIICGLSFFLRETGTRTHCSNK